jgi:hypothetical protein
MFRYSEAAPLLDRALKIMAATLGINRPSTMTARGNLAAVLKKMSGR